MSLLFAGTEVAIMIASLARGGRIWSNYEDFATIIVMQLLPGILIFGLAGAAGRGDPNAFFVIFGAAILSPIRTVLALCLSGRSSLACTAFGCDVFTSIPLLFLIMTCKESLVEVRQVIRRRREDRSADQRGFVPILADSPPAVPRQIQQEVPELPEKPLLPVVDSAKFVVAPPRRRRTIMSDYMHQATRFANIVAGLSLIGVIVLLLISYAIRLKGSGNDAFDLTTQSVLIFYVAPAAILFFLAWRMDRQDLWPFPLCTIVSIGLVARLCVSFALFRITRTQTARIVFYVDLAVRIPTVWLLLKCIYAMPDVWDLHKQHRRQVAIDKKMATGETRPISVLASITPPPASGTRTVARRPD